MRAKRERHDFLCMALFYRVWAGVKRPAHAHVTAPNHRMPVAVPHGSQVLFTSASPRQAFHVHAGAAVAVLLRRRLAFLDT